MKKFFYTLLVVAIFACETEIDPDLGGSLNVIVVDAWLTNQGTVQHINVTRSQSYFDDTDYIKVSNASVIISDLTDPSNDPYVFNEGATQYTWTSPDGSPLGIIGHEYELTVVYEGDTYSSRSRLNRVPAADSIGFRLEPENAFTDATIFAEIFATDLPGSGDTYWIKSWKNGQYLGLPGQMNIAFDAAFTGGNVDGEVFIQPIQDEINTFASNKEDEFLSPINLPMVLPLFSELDNSGNTYRGQFVGRKGTDDEYYAHIEDEKIFYEYYQPTPNSDSSLVFENRLDVALDLYFEDFDSDRFTIDGDSLYVKGDSMYVEIHSISNEAHFFLTQVQIETTRSGGFGALFATPLANVSTNIVSSDPDKRVVGFFNMAAVSSVGRRLNDESELRIIQ